MVYYTPFTQLWKRRNVKKCFRRLKGKHGRTSISNINMTPPSQSPLTQLSSTLESFQESHSLSELYNSLQDIQDNLKSYFVSQQPGKLIQEHSAALTKRLNSSAAATAAETHHNAGTQKSPHRNTDNAQMEDDDDDDDNEEQQQQEEEKSPVQHQSFSAPSNTQIIQDIQLVYNPSVWESKSKKDSIMRLIVEFLLREGMTKEAELLCQEAGVSLPNSLKNQFESMRHVMDSLRQHETHTTLQWCDEQVKLVQNCLQQDSVPEDAMTDESAPDFHQHIASLPAPKKKKLLNQLEHLQFRLHRMRYIQLLLQHAKDDNDVTMVVQYARNHLAPFSKNSSYMHDIRTLMGALLYANKLTESPYAHLASLDSTQEWEEIAKLFKEIACATLNIPQYSPLYVATLAGASALPILLKQADVIKNTMNSDEWDKFRKADQLTVRIPLDEDFHFRNIFTCPVSHEIATPLNPPVLLPCGHVLCKNTVDRMAPSRGANRCKCPYCRSTEFLKSKCQELHFG